MEKNNQPIILGAMVIGAILIISLALIFTRDSDETTPETANENNTSEDQENENVEEAENESTTPAEQNTDNSDSNDSNSTGQTANGTNDLETIDSTPQPPPSAIVDIRLPSSWDELSGPEKTSLNPHGCFEKAIIRADNGRCVIEGTSINYIYVRSDDPQSWHPALISPRTHSITLAVPDGTSNEDIDKLSEHFRLEVIEQKFAGSPPKVISPSKAFKERLNVFYYDDLENAEGYLFIKHNARRVRTYELRSRHIFGVFAFGGYTNYDAGEHKTIHEEGPDGCAATLELALLYNPGLFQQAGEAFYVEANKPDFVHYYGALDATEADFRAAFVDEQGMLKPDMRESLLPVFGIWNDGLVPGQFIFQDQYDIRINFYRYDDAKGYNFNLYDEADIFDSLPTLSVVECS